MNMAKLLDVHAIHLGIDEPAELGGRTYGCSECEQQRLRRSRLTSAPAICVRHLSLKG